MGILDSIANFLTGTYDEDYERGSNWAERVYTSGKEVDHEQASYLADEYGTDPNAFYDGFRDTYNDYARIHNMHVAYQRGEEYKEPDTLKRFVNWCRGY